MNAGRENRILRDTQMIFMAKTLVRLYGEEALDLLVEYKQKKTKRAWEAIAQKTGRSDVSYLLRLFHEDAHEYEVIEDTQDRLEVIVTKCVHADVFREYNAVELGEKMICSGDYAVIEGYDKNIVLQRKCTAMTSDTCHFVFERKRTVE